MIKKFKAPTMREAMELAKEYFGDDALVLKSQKVKARGLSGADEDLIEITVTSEKAAAVETVDPAAQKAFYSPDNLPRVRKLQPDKTVMEIKDELNELKASIGHLSDYMRYSKMILLPDTLRFLVDEKGFDEDLAAELIHKIHPRLGEDRLKSDRRIREELQREVSSQIRVNDDLSVPEDRPKVICMVGPTGMGKTTTIIKLATHPQFYGKRRVALITIDTYRVAAAAQLKTFAALAKLPLEIVYEPREFQSAMEKFQSHEVVLVDTAGRSPRNTQHLEELERFLRIRRPDELHLVLSVSTRTDSLVDAIEAFSTLSVNRLVASKVDETSRLGNILNIARTVELPISFLTNGQRVPDDILLANKKEIARLILS